MLWCWLLFVAVAVVVADVFAVGVCNGAFLLLLLCCCCCCGSCCCCCSVCSRLLWQPVTNSRVSKPIGCVVVVVVVVEGLLTCFLLESLLLLLW